MSIRRSTRIALFLGLAATAFGLDPDHKLTQYVHRIWQTQPGLPQTTIFTVSQTRDGYLWLGTESGIVRFDGVRFTQVPELERASLDDIRARGFAEDSRGRVWITSSNLGVVRIGDGAVKVFKAADGLPPGEISCLFATQTGDIWMCGASGMFRAQGDELQSYSEDLQGRPLVGCEAPDHTIWIAGDGWLDSWTGSQFKRYPLRSVPADAGVRALVCREDGLWIGTRRGLVHFSDGKEVRYSKENGLPDSVIFSLANGSQGELWIGTPNGLSRFVRGAFDNFSYGDGLSQKDVNSIYEDREGSLWVATKYGLNQFLDGPATRFTRNEGLPSNKVGPILEDRTGKIWVGFLDAGLARWNGFGFAPVPDLVSRNVTALLETKDGSVWAGTDKGLDRLEGGIVKEHFNLAEGLPSNRIRSLYLDHSGTLWAGTENGAAMFKGGRFVVPPAFVPVLQVPIAAIGETGKHQILFAVERGNVYSLANGSLSPLSDGSPSAARVTNIISIYSDDNGLVWMGTNGFGLWLLRDGKIHRIYRTDGLFDGEIYGFASDSGGRLWMVCSKGFYSVAKADLLAFADKRVKKIKSFAYVPLEGLRAIQGRQGVQPGAISGRDGKLWFTTLEGLIQYTPNLGAGNNPPPPVEIEDVTIAGERTRAGAIKRLGPGKENVAFRYTALSFLAPESMTFRYRLEGYDRDWTDAGTRREAFYTNLPAGNFRFRVTACSPFVPCNESGAVVNFEIVPHLYQRIWFWPLIAAALSLLFWLAHRLRIARLESEFSIVVAERTRIARELHDTLIQGFSGITLQMQALAERLLPSRDRHFLEDIIRDAGDCLKETRQSVAGLRDGEEASPELADAIADVANGIAREYGSTLILNLDETPQRISAGIRYNLVRIVQEAVLNSARHSGSATIEVSLSHVKNELRLSISDHGRGIKGAATDDVKSHHYGIVGMRERAEHIGAEFELARTPGGGTTITVRISGTAKVSPTVPRGKMETAP